MDSFSQPDESSQDVCITQMMDIMTQDGNLTPNECSNLTPPTAESPTWGRLVSMDGSTTAKKLSDAAYLLGRSKQSCITLPSDFPTKDTLFYKWAHNMISNRHCVIHKLDDSVLMKDTSHNGVFVNDKKVMGSQILKTGDEICLLSRAILTKKIRSSTLLKQLLSRYTFIFVPKKQRPNTNYELQELLGRGTVGEVRRAIHVATNKQYAVKTIAFTMYSESEVNILRQLEHPYIIQLFDVYKTDKLNLVMEYVPGGDLYESIVERGQYSELDARKVIRRLLSVIYYLHNTLNVLHRDLKPENILVGDTIKVTDFGVARFDNAQAKTFCGTPQYFAPELLNRNLYGRSVYGKPADMWSCGMIAYVLLTGSNYEPDNYDGIPDLARDFIVHLLEMDPEKRYTVLEACEHPWILMEDSDTHCHPLEDPLLSDVHRKGYERKPSQVSDEKPMDGATKEALSDSDASQKSGLDLTEDHSIKKKPLADSLPSQPTTAVATQRVDSSSGLANNTNSESEAAETTGDTLDQTNTRSADDGEPKMSKAASSATETRKVSSSPRLPTIGRDGTTNTLNASLSKRRFSPSALANESARKNLVRSDSTPQTCNKKQSVSTPRRPLSQMNRKDGAEGEAALFDPIKLLSSKESDGHDSPPEAPPHTSKSTEDEILSQFSEKTESIDSFGSMIPIVEADHEPKQKQAPTSTKKTTQKRRKSVKTFTRSKKRTAEEPLQPQKSKTTRVETDGKSKGKEEKHGKQTTIKNWFSKKG